jgi:superoxide dismutase, Cu-Zn family
MTQRAAGAPISHPNPENRMKRLLLAGALAALALSFSLAAAQTQPATTNPHTAMWAGVTRAVAVLQPTKGNSVAGAISFDAVPDGVHVHGTITGLAPNSSHGFHIHQFGDASSDDGTAAGGHYNPENHLHAGPADASHHAGDLGNVTADASGKATIDITAKGISIAGMTDPIIGRGVVLHADPDDLKTQPTGNAGARIAVGVIGVAKPQ